MNDIMLGDRAPDFTTTDLDGNTIQISDYVGKKTLLVFFRFASCPLCTVRFAQLIQNYPEYSKKGLNIIAVFESSPEYIRRYVNDKRKVPFPIIADPEGELYKLYNVKKSIVGTMKGMFRIFKMLKSMMDPAYSMGKPDGSITRIPADFLINPLMVVTDSYYGSDIGDHIPLNRITHFINNGK
ncbi:MAG: redoxin domain-containing protein [Gammaproteobacteria bacterium]|nr:redoxin domain-containing protein [Gammaproteobacteria bacterium]